MLSFRNHIFFIVGFMKKYISILLFIGYIILAVGSNSHRAPVEGSSNSSFFVVTKRISLGSKKLSVLKGSDTLYNHRAYFPTLHQIGKRNLVQQVDSGVEVQILKYDISKKYVYVLTFEGDTVWLKSNNIRICHVK